MKNFIVSLAALIVITAAVTANCIFITSFTERIDELTRQLPPYEMAGGTLASDKAYSDLIYLWEKNKFILCLTVSHGETDNIDALIVEAEAAFNCGDAGAYESAKHLLTDAIDKLRHSETLSIAGIL